MRKPGPRKPNVRRSLPAAALAALLASSCAEPLVIGFAASMSGKDATLGVEGRNAAEMFVRRVNRDGGVAGRLLKLSVMDFESDPAKVVPVDQALFDQGAIAIVGHYESSNALAALPFANERGIALVSPAATSGALSGKDDCFFRTIMSTDRDPEFLGRAMKDRGVARVVAVGSSANPAYVDDYVGYIATAFTLVDRVSFESVSGIDFDGIAAGRFDAVLIVANPIDTAMIAQGLRLKGVGAPFFLSGWAGSEALVEYGGSSVEGAVFVHQVDLSLETLASFAKDYRDTYGTAPSFVAVETMEAMLLVAEAIRLGGRDRASFLEAIAKVRIVDAPSGRIVLDGTGDAKRPVYLKEVRDGKIVARGVVE